MGEDRRRKKDSLCSSNGESLLGRGEVSVGKRRDECGRRIDANEADGVVQKREETVKRSVILRSEEGEWESERMDTNKGKRRGDVD